MNTDENKIYLDVEKQAIKSLDIIMANYNHTALTIFAQILKSVFHRIYEKIVVNKNTLAMIRELCQSRKGPIVFCPTHRSYMDFLLVSIVLFFYQMEVPFICAGEDLMMIAGVHRHSCQNVHIPCAPPIRTAQTVILEFGLINFSLIWDFQGFKIAII